MENDKIKEIKINENFKIDDSINSNNENHPSPITGVFRIYDNDGNLIKEQHNMVVNSGRHLLATLFHNYFSSNKSPTSLSGNLFLYLSYKTPYVQTEPSLTYDDIKSNDANRKFDWRSNKLEFDLSESNSFTFTIDVASTDEFNKFNQVYLAYNDSSNENKYILFSRVALDPIFLGTNGKYKLAYTLYF